MSDYDVDTIAVDENHRIVVKYDESPSNPRTDEDWMLTGFVTVSGNRRTIDVAPIYDDPTGWIPEAHERLSELRSFDSRGYRDDVVARWARIFHNLVVEYDAEHGGYWFVDPNRFAEAGFTLDEHGDIVHRAQDFDAETGKYLPTYHVTGTQNVAEFQRSIIDAERQNYNAWANGEVYGIIAEKRIRKHVTVFDKSEFAGDPVNEYDEEDWTEEESLWGIYEVGYKSFTDMVKDTVNGNFPDEFHLA